MNQLFAALYPLAVANARHWYSHDHDTAEDIATEAFVRLWEAMVNGSYDPAQAEAVVVFLLTTVKRLAITQLRKDGRIQHASLQADDEEDTQDSTPPDASVDVERQAIDALAFARAWHDLTELERAAILRIALGFTRTEAADRLGVTYEQLRYAEEKALEKLQQYM